MGVISGDGVPVSGLLTIFRNVVDLGQELDLVEVPVPAELGYSWRPDKPGYFPDGPPEPESGEFLVDLAMVSRPVTDAIRAAPEWTWIRNAVARADELDASEQDLLRQRIDRLAAPYQDYFERWMSSADVDWICAVNMTLSDAVPVTTALHRAAAVHYGRRRSGGVLFWDHDLFESCAIYEDGQRLYPDRPNAFTPLPDDLPRHRWAVVSDPLAAEAARYPTMARPRVVPNILPRIPAGPLEDRHHEFLAQQGLSPDRPLLLNPVRVFRVKGVEIALDVLAGARSAGRDHDLPTPALLVFGSLTEDPPYADQVVARAESLDLGRDLRFLGGVPLRSHRDPEGRWHLDEIDLLRLAVAGGGGVVFTPNTTDVETVGLGPALAAVAGLPCVTTPYEAFLPAYGEDFRTICIRGAELDAHRAGRALVEAMRSARSGAGPYAEVLRTNRQIIEQRFPIGPWSDLLKELEVDSGPVQSGPVDENGSETHYSGGSPT